MAPAQNKNISNENNYKYTHKKFQGKRIYAHKKFGNCLSATPPKCVSKITEEETPAGTKSETQINNENTTSKHSTTKDLFRPYALPDKTPKKRKHQELERDPSVEEYEMDYKRFAHSYPPTIPSPAFTPAFPIYDNYFMNPATALMFNPYYRLQQYQFNPQIFSLLLQKQSDAMCLGALLKKQANLNFDYNIMGQQAPSV